MGYIVKIIREKRILWHELFSANAEIKSLIFPVARFVWVVLSLLCVFKMYWPGN